MRTSAQIPLLERLGTPIPGLTLIQRRPNGDSRGHFARVFCAEELKAAGWTEAISQVNVASTAKRGTVRGLHFQHPPYAESKIVVCLRGEIFDVALDLRQGSPTFMRWHGEYLSAANMRALLLPRGFAHGYQTMADDTELLYLHDAPWYPTAEGGINPFDPRIAVTWPLPVTALSDRDQSHAPLTPDFRGIQT